MKRFVKVLTIAMTVLIGTSVLHGSAYAQIDKDPKTNARNSRIVGLWNVDVVTANCISGETMFTFSAMHQYQLGGTGQVVPAGNPTALSAHMMIWSHVRNNDYRMAMKMYRYDPSGNYIGWAIVRNEVSISEDANEYVGSGVAELFDTGGNFLGSSCPSFVGTRFSGQ